MWAAVFDILKIGAVGWILASVWGLVWVIGFGGDLDVTLDTAWVGFVVFALCAVVWIGWNRIKPRAKER